MRPLDNDADERARAIYEAATENYFVPDWDDLPGWKKIRWYNAEIANRKKQEEQDRRRKNRIRELAGLPLKDRVVAMRTDVREDKRTG